MCNKKAKEFKKQMKTKEKLYYKQLNSRIRTLRSTNSKEYWSLLNKSTEGKKEYSKLCLQTFMEHFKKLNQADATSNDNNVTNQEAPIQNAAESNQELNFEFTAAEITKIISKLKNNKASGIDLIRNEFLKKSPPCTGKFYM